MLELREKLAADIAALTHQADAANAEDAPDPQALPRELAHREALKEKLDAACARLEEAARADHGAAKADYARRRAAYVPRPSGGASRRLRRTREPKVRDRPPRPTSKAI